MYKKIFTGQRVYYLIWWVENFSLLIFLKNSLKRDHTKLLHTAKNTYKSSNIMIFKGISNVGFLINFSKIFM